jgi:2-dehydro-3-deoxyphosphogluconate aldolase/(4S)-4-hydroxy-2-oxoglutarate aldolase
MRSIVSDVSWAFDSVASLEGPTDLADLLGPQAVVPLVEVDDDARAVALARVLVDSGLPVMEIALRTPGAMSALQAVRSAVPDAVVGVGTVLSSEQLSAAAAAGAAFAVSPGSSGELLAAAPGCPVPYVPGVATATELMRVVEAGIREVKFFPAEACGGASAVAALSAVASSVRFLPTGGIDAGSAPAYLVLGPVFAVGGSWVCPRDLIRGGSWDQIGRLALAASRLSRSDPV